MRLEGKVAIVAGGGQGIGEGIVSCLAAEGADVAVFDINAKTAAQMAEKVNKMGRKALAVTADLTNEKQAYKAVKDTVDFFGKLDILINNVGGVSVEMGQAISEYFLSNQELATLPQYMRLSSGVWDKFYELNLKTHVIMSQAVTPYFTKQRSGKIVNISSIAGRLGDPGNMAYAAMKAGDISLTWSLARALATYNITVNCVCPGFVYTPLWERGASGYLNAARETLRAAKKRGEKLPPPYENADLENITAKEYWLKYIVIPSTPNGREQTPEDMGKAVVFFVSEDAKNITGQVLHVDGGYVMR